MTFTQRAVEAGLSAFKACRPVERTACQDFGMQQDDIIRQQLEAALSASLAVDGLCLVPCEPTGVMREAGAKFSAVCCAETGCIVGEVYRAMLAAANDGEERK